MAELSIPARWASIALAITLNQGWDADQLLKDAQISPLILTEGKARITAEQIRRLAAALSAETDDEFLGVSAVPVPRGTLQMLAYSLFSAENLEKSLARLSTFRTVIPGVPAIDGAVGRDRLATVSVDVSHMRHPGFAMTEVLLTALHRSLGWITMRKVPLNRVMFPHPRPKGMANYSRVFNAPLEFDCATASLVVEAEFLQAPILRSETEIVALIGDPIELILSGPDFGNTLPDRVRRILCTALGSQILTVEQVAAALAVSPQVLRRQLRMEFFTSVRQLRDEVLRDEALASLVKGRETVAELSARLGFSEPSAFTRAFRRWTGSTPGAYRAT